MGAEVSTPRAPAYQPSYLEQHVRKVGDMQSPPVARTWQGQRSNVGNDALMISEAKKVTGLVAGQGGVRPTEAVHGSIGETWLMMQMKKAADAIKEPINDLPGPSVPADSWLLKQAKEWSAQRPEPRNPLHPSYDTPPSVPANSGWLTGVVPLQEASPVAMPPIVPVGGNAPATSDDGLSPTESDRSDSVPSSSEEGETAEERFLPDSTRSQEQLGLAASPEPIISVRAAAVPPSDRARRAVGNMSERKGIGNTSERKGNSARTLFVERIKSLQTQAFASSSPHPALSGGRVSPLPLEKSTSPASSSRKPAKFPWMTAKETMSQSRKIDLYRMGRYDVVTANLHGAYEVVKGGDQVYTGIDAELAA